MKNLPTTKKGLIFQHLMRGQSLTGLQALKQYGVYRLSSTINRLRNEGYDIKTTIRYDLFGNEYGEYQMINNPD